MGLKTEIGRLYRYEMELPFTLSEYKERMTKVKEVMAKQKVDLLYCTAPGSLFYLTGWQADWWNPKSLDGIAIKQDADKFILFTNHDEDILVHTGTIATDFRIEDKYFMVDPEFIIRNLRQEGWLKGTIGLEKWSFHPDTPTIENFQSALEKEGCAVVDSSDVIREIMWIKSPQELVYVRKAAAIADIGMKAGINAIKPGATELDIRAEIAYTMGKAGGENPSIVTMVQTGQRTMTVHSPTSRHAVMPGDLVSIDLCGVYHRYHVDVARMISVGEPHPKVAKQIDLSLKGLPVLLENIKPNCPVTNVTKALEAYFKEAGIWEDRWWSGGYDLPVSFPPDWCGSFWYTTGEEYAPDKVFSPGMVVNYETDFYLPQGAGMSLIIDTLEITDGGAKVLSKIPNALVVVEA